MQIWQEMNELCTQHLVTACWELKNVANMVRNERTKHTARGYRVVGSPKMVQIWSEMDEPRTQHAVTA